MEFSLSVIPIFSLSTSLSPSAHTTDFMGYINVEQQRTEWTETVSGSSHQRVCVSMVKIEVYLGSSNSLWSAEGCH